MIVDNKVNKIVSVAFTETEKKVLLSLAKKDRRTISSFLRYLVIDTLQEKHPNIFQEDHPEEN